MGVRWARIDKKHLPLQFRDLTKILGLGVSYLNQGYIRAPDRKTLQALLDEGSFTVEVLPPGANGWYQAMGEPQLSNPQKRLLYANFLSRGYSNPIYPPYF